MKDRLRIELSKLNPIGACEGKSKYESIEWAYFEGYKLRKALELQYLYSGSEKDIVFFNSYSRKWEVTAYGQKRLSELNKGIL